MATWTTGDVVELKSGGPTMTVQAVVGEMIHCKWFEGTESRKDVFHRDSLRPAQEN